MIVPSAFETCVTATSLVRSLSSFSYSSSSTWPLSSTGIDAQLRALLGGELLPGHDVGVVLQVRDDDLVARADVRAAPALRDQVDGLGRAAHEDDLVCRRRVEERAHLVARSLVGVGRARGERVRGAMDVGVLVRVEVREAVDHRLRLLRRGGVVEPDQRPAVDALVRGSGSRAGPRARRTAGCAGPAEYACRAESARAASGIDDSRTAASRLGR